MDLATAAQRAPAIERASGYINYRVRHIPINYNLEETKSLLRTVLKLDDACKLRVGSIAPDLENENLQVATISFEGQSKLLPRQDDKNRMLDQWIVASGTSDDSEGWNNSEETLTIDTHFRDFTPLNAPKDDRDAFDLIAVCGLNGHAFGSFKERGGEYMWLRDGIPQERTLRGVRVIIYGYDSQIVGSRSFQGLGAIASTFKNRLKGLRRCLPSVERPIVLLSHSLGGLVVKEALIQMAEGAAAGDRLDLNMLFAVYAVLFFGVPSRGMENKSLMAMVQGQPNAPFVSILDRNSEALATQHRRFCEAFPFPDSVVFSFFETEQSPTAIQIHGRWEMNGPLEVLVDITSATQSRGARESTTYFLQAINRSHSELVKYSRDDEYYKLIKGKLDDIAEKAAKVIHKRFQSLLGPGGYKGGFNGEVELNQRLQTLTGQSSNLIGLHNEIISRLTGAGLLNRSATPNLVVPNMQNHPLHVQGEPQASIRSPSTFNIMSLDVLEDSSTISQPTKPFPMAMFYPGLSGTLDEVRSRINIVQEETEHKLRENFLSALESSESCLSSRPIPNRYVGTCEWFFATIEYSKWVERPQPQTFIITAPAGRGKSVLAKYLVKRLQQENEDNLVLSYFCKDENNSLKKAMLIVRNLLHQLLRGKKELLRYVPRQALIMEGEKALTFQNLWDVMMHVLRASDLKDVYCIIDGLDECDDESANILKEAFERDILPEETTPTSIRARFLITSQPIKSALLLAQKSVYLSIRPEHVNGDITEYVHGGIKSLKRVGPEAKLSSELTDYIGNSIQKQAEGSFQWAKLVLKELEDVPTSRNSIMQVFQQVPKGLKSLYEECFRKISLHDLAKARKIFTILLFASRALTPRELAICMLTNPTGYRTHSQLENDFDDSMEWEANITCGSFLDVTDKLINITHQSARDSLMSFSAQHSPNNDFVPFNAEEGHRILAMNCLYYLLLDDFQDALTVINDDTVDEKFPFLRYAEGNWDVHLRNVSNLDGFENILQKFFARSVLRTRPWRAAWPQMLDCFPQWEGFEDSAILHLLVHTGLLNLLKRCKLGMVRPSLDFAYARQSSLLGEAVAAISTGSQKPADFPILTLVTDVEDEDALGNTSLMRAMKAWEWEIVFWLILTHNANLSTVNDQGSTIAHIAALTDFDIFILLLQILDVDTNRVDGFGGTPLESALLLGCEKAAAVLLRNTPECDPRSGLTPLHLVAESGCETLLQLALEHSPEVNQGTKTKKTALMMASEKGHYGIVLKLLNQCADADLKDNWGMSALHYAAQTGKDKIVQALLQQEVLPNDVDQSERTPLHLAAEGGHEEVVRHLIPKISDLDARDVEGWTALHSATYKDCLSIVKLLVESGANINQVSEDGWTPFHLAAGLGHVDIAHFLATRNGALLDTVTKEGYNPLLSAARGGFEAIVSLLLHHRVDVDRKIVSDVGNCAPMSPLQAAAEGGFLTIVKDLIDAKASVNSTCGSGFTPLLCAAMSNHPDVVHFLLDKRAEPHCFTNDGRNPLHSAAAGGHEALVTRFLESGIDASSQDARGFTPVHCACRNGSVRILEKLLAWGGSLKETSNSQWSPLHSAVDSQKEDMTRFLIQMKVDVGQRTEGGTTPLVLAAGKDNYTILRLLLENGALSQEPPPNCWSPLHEAAFRGLERNVELLLKYHHPVDIVDVADATPLLYAADKGHVIVVKMLLNHKANIKAVSKNGLSFLIGAVRSRSRALVRLGIESGVDINCASLDIAPPIMIAIEQGDREVFKELLSKGARCVQEPITKATALHLAAHSGFLGIVQDLLGAGSDPDARDVYGRTPLQLATMCYHKATVRALVKHGADLKALDCFGRTAYYWARRRFNHGLDKANHSLTRFELGPSHRRQRLESSIRFCIDKLLRFPEENYPFYVLGKCLQFEEDSGNACIAFEQRMDHTRRPEMVHIPSCSVCGPYKGIQGYRYVCSSCADIDLCAPCFHKSWDPRLLGRDCHSHSFLTVPGKDWESRPVGVVSTDGLSVEDWLRALRPPRTVGLQDWYQGTWTRAEQQMQSQPGFWDLVDVFWDDGANAKEEFDVEEAIADLG